MRLLHLVDANPPGRGGSDADLLAVRACARPDDAIVAVGDGRAPWRVDAIGLRATVLVAPTGRLPLAWSRLRRLRLRPDVIHCWSPTTLPLARLAFGTTPKVTMDGATGRDIVRSLSFADDGETRLVPPRLVQPNEQAGTTEAVRIGLAPTTDLRRLIFIFGLLNVLGERVEAFADPTAPGFRDWRRFLKHAGIKGPVRAADRPIASSLGDCDLLAGGVGPRRRLNVLACAAADAGVPFIMPDCSVDADLVPESARDACLRDTSIRAMASGLLDLVEHEGRRRDVASSLRKRLAPDPGEVATIAWGGL